MINADLLPWRTSSYSSNGEACVDVAPSACSVLLRHSKHHDHGIIEFTPGGWSTFTREAGRRSGSANGAASITADGVDTLVASSSGVQLRFDAVEWSAFVAGIEAGEFEFGSASGGAL